MNLYQINWELEQLLQGRVNEETGEVEVDYSELDALLMQREEKIENLLLYIKNLKAFATAIEEEIKKLKTKLESVNKKIDRLTDYVQGILQGEKFTTPRVSVSYKPSESVSVDEDFIEYAKKHCPELLREKHSFEPDKVEIKKILKSGHDIPYAHLSERIGMTIK